MLLRFLGTLCISLVLLLVFATWLFPVQALEQRLNYEFSQRLPIATTIQGLSYTFPSGLRVDRITVELPPQAPRSRLVMRDTAVQLAPQALLANRIDADIQLTVLQGRATLQTALEPAWAPQRFQAQGDWQELALEELGVPDMLSTVTALNGSCMLNGTASGALQDPLAAQGHGTIQIANGNVAFPLPGRTLRFPDLSGNGQWHLTKQQWTLTRSTITAKGARASLSGSLNLKPEIGASPIDFQGQAAVSGANPEAYSLLQSTLGQSELGLTLFGTLDAPRYRLES